MAAEQTELESLIIRLLGDGTSYLGMLKQAEQHTEIAAKSIEGAGKRIEGITSAINSFGAGLLAFVGFEQLKGMFDKFSEYERNTIVFSSLLRANGRDVQAVLGDYRAFSKEIAGVTTASAGSIMALLKTAEAMGLSGDAAKRAVEGAKGLALIGEVEEGVALRIVVAMEKGDLATARLFSRHVPALRQARTDTEFLAAAQRLMAAGFEAEREFAGTSAGKLEQFGHVIQGLKKDIGGLIAEVMLPLFSRLKTISQEIAAGWRFLADSAGVSWGWIKEKVELAADTIEFSIRHADTVVRHIWTGMAMAGVSAWDTIRDGFVIATAAIVGLGGVIVESFKAAWTNIITGAKVAFEFMKAAAAAASGDIVNATILYTSARSIQNQSQYVNQGEAAARGFERGFNGVIDRLGVGESALYRNLKREFEEQGKELGISFEQFRAARQAAEGGPGNPIAPMLSTAQALNAEMTKFDAALSRSSEASTRIAAYSQANFDVRLTGGSQTGASNSAQVRAADYLKMIHDQLRGLTGQAFQVGGIS